MESVELVELAALVSRHGSLVIRSHGRLSTEGLRGYWKASKCRLDRWGLALRRYERETERHNRRAARLLWPRTRSAMVEVLSGEVLARVWTAVVSAHDRRRDLEESEPVAQSVLLGHMESRRRVLALLADGGRMPRHDAALLNLLRRRCERWTDLLIGYLMADYDVASFAFKPQRARDLAESVSRRQRAGADSIAWQLTLNSIRQSFWRSLASSSPNCDLNRQIASSILACFPPDLFETGSSVGSLWLLRMQNTQADAEDLVEELLEMEGLRAARTGQ